MMGGGIKNVCYMNLYFLYRCLTRRVYGIANLGDYISPIPPKKGNQKQPLIFVVNIGVHPCSWNPKVCQFKVDGRKW